MDKLDIIIKKQDDLFKKINDFVEHSSFLNFEARLKEVEEKAEFQKLEIAKLKRTDKYHKYSIIFSIIGILILFLII